MKYIKFLIVFFTIIFLSCSQQFREITPVSNQDSIKIKLELSAEKPAPGSRDEFTIKLTNTGVRDLARCSLKLDNKYEHQLEGLINKTDDWIGKPETSMLPTGESAIIVFSSDFDNYTIFGITDKDFRVPETIELKCLDGKVVWKTK
jgi:hypothetical protein